MTIGQKIRELRKKKSLTQKQLAEALGVTEGQISHYETDKNTPTLDTLYKIANILNTSIAELNVNYSINIDSNKLAIDQNMNITELQAKVIELLERIAEEQNNRISDKDEIIKLHKEIEALKDKYERRQG